MRSRVGEESRLYRSMQLDRLKADAALAEFCAGQDLGLKFFAIALAEKQAFADADFAAGTNQAFPIVRVGGKLAGQQNLDAAVEQIASASRRP